MILKILNLEVVIAKTLIVLFLDVILLVDYTNSVL